MARATAKLSSAHIPQHCATRRSPFAPGAEHRRKSVRVRAILYPCIKNINSSHKFQASISFPPPTSLEVYRTRIVRLIPIGTAPVRHITFCIFHRDLQDLSSIAEHPDGLHPCHMISVIISSGKGKQQEQGANNSPIIICCKI